MDSEAQPKRAMPRFIGLAISAILIVVVFAIINLVLVGGQKLWHHKDKVKLEALQNTLKNETIKINQYENKIQANVISDREYMDYSRLIDTYNSQVEEANDLAEKVGTTWYIIPLPGKGHLK